MMPQAHHSYKVGETVRVNVRTKVNSDMIRKEKRDGRDVIVVRSATLPDNVVMNGILYPAEEIEKSYKSLNDTPAPLGHPVVDGMFVSAKTPLGLNLGYFGAWNANAQRKDGRVFVDKIIDVERANESKMGQKVLAALEKGDPIHTSTGLTMRLRDCTNSDLAEVEGYDMNFDHDAILLDEEGAATPEQGVGMLVNAKGEQTKVAAINSSVEERMDEHIDMLGMELLSALDRKEAASRWGRIKEAIMEALSLGREEQSDPEEIDMADGKKEGLDELVARVEKMETSVNKIVETVESLGETVEAVNKAVEAVNADRKAAHEALVNKAVEAKLLTEEEAKSTPAKALEVMLNAAAPKKDDSPSPAPGIFGGFAGNSDNNNVEAFSPLGVAKKEA